MAKCRFCSAEIPADSAFCENCGNKNPIADEPVVPAPAEPPKKDKKGLVIGILAGIIVLLLVLGVLFFVFGDKIFGKDNADVPDDEETSEEDASDNDSENDAEEDGADDDDSASEDENQGNSSEKPAPPAVIELSDSIYDGTIEIDGFVYQLPCKVSDFLYNGWKIDSRYSYGYNYSDDYDCINNEYIGGYSGSYLYLYKGDLEDDGYNLAYDAVTISITFVNLSNTKEKISDCYVNRVDIDKESAPDFKLPENVDFNSSYNDVVAVYGEPGYGDSDYFSYYYGDDFFWCDRLRTAKSGDKYVYFCMDYMNGYCNYECLIIPDNFKFSVSTAVPEYLSKYKAPTELGYYLDSGNLKLDGVLYQLPCPVSVFEDNGWVLENSTDEFSFDGNSYLASGDSESAVLRKGSCAITVDIRNLDEDACVFENGVVTSVEFDENSTGVAFELPGEIKIGGMFSNSDGLFEYDEYDDEYSYWGNNGGVYLNTDDSGYIIGLRIFLFYTYVDSLADMNPYNY